MQESQGTLDYQHDDDDDDDILTLNKMEGETCNIFASGIKSKNKRMCPNWLNCFINKQYMKEVQKVQKFNISVALKRKNTHIPTAKILHIQKSYSILYKIILVAL